MSMEARKTPEMSESRCIYCKKSACENGSPLSREHIIPKSLGGTRTIKAASCLECARQTLAFEGYCAGTMLVNARKYLKLPKSRERRKKGWPKPRIIVFKDDGSAVEINHSISELPPILNMPSLEESTFSRGKPPNKSVVIGIKNRPILLPGATYRQILSYERLPENASFEFPMHFVKFAQMLAKIGHCEAIQGLGRGGFEPLLIDTILGQTEYAFHYVGGEDENLPHDGKSLHACKLGIDENGMVSCLIRLFSGFSTPTYKVIVGPKNTDQLTSAVG